MSSTPMVADDVVWVLLASCKAIHYSQSEKERRWGGGRGRGGGGAYCKTRERRSGAN